jgi:NADPH:quinone reductase-like Zn-dependent oxidoreductase
VPIESDNHVFNILADTFGGMSSSHRPLSTKAWFLVKNGNSSEAFELRTIDLPPPGEGEVLIESEGFGLNFAEVMARLGLYREAPPLPFVPGYECVGRVMATGPGVTEDLAGKRVVAMARFGSYARHVLTKASGVAEIPEGMGAAEASAFAVQFTTAYYSAMHAMRLLPGERVLVHAGAGGVGAALIQLCKLAGCEVFATAGSDEKLIVMRQLGADHVVNYRKEDYEVVFRNILGSKRMDAGFNAVGGKTFKKDLKLLGSGGRLVIFGAAQRASSSAGIWPTIKLLWDMGLVMPIMLMAKSRSLIGVNALKLADHRPDIIAHCMRESVKLAAEGKVKPLVGAEFNSGQLAEAHALLESRQSVGKVFVKW